jgi:hypothetical protein
MQIALLRGVTETDDGDTLLLGFWTRPRPVGGPWGGDDRSSTSRWWFVSCLLLEIRAGDAPWASVSYFCAALLARNMMVDGLLGFLKTIVLLSLGTVEPEGVVEQGACCGQRDLYSWGCCDWRLAMNVVDGRIGRREASR